MRRAILAVVLWGLVGLCFFATVHFARAQTTIQDTIAAPAITFTPEALLHFWSAQALARGVATDAQWATAMGQIFSTSAFPGADPTALAFLRSFFTQYVHVGP